jgi:hypothetical protein
MDERGNLHTPAVTGARGVARFMGAVFGVAFGGIGVSVIAFLWSADADPPLIFRLVGTFIALVFVGFGVGILYSVITGPGMLSGADRAHPGDTGSRPPPANAGYRCPNCGAPLGQEADVSPMGDVKCAFCKTWFNVHGRTTA